MFGCLVILENYKLTPSVPQWRTGYVMPLIPYMPSWRTQYVKILKAEVKSSAHQMWICLACGILVTYRGLVSISYQSTIYASSVFYRSFAILFLSCCEKVWGEFGNIGKNVSEEAKNWTPGSSRKDLEWFWERRRFRQRGNIRKRSWIVWTLTTNRKLCIENIAQVSWFHLSFDHVDVISVVDKSLEHGLFHYFYGKPHCTINASQCSLDPSQHVYCVKRQHEQRIFTKTRSWCEHFRYGITCHVTFQFLQKQFQCKPHCTVNSSQCPLDPSQHVYCVKWQHQQRILT